MKRFVPYAFATLIGCTQWHSHEPLYEEPIYPVCTPSGATQPKRNGISITLQGILDQDTLYTDSIGVRRWTSGGPVNDALRFAVRSRTMIDEVSIDLSGPTVDLYARSDPAEQWKNPNCTALPYGLAGLSPGAYLLSVMAISSDNLVSAEQRTFIVRD